MSEPLPDRLARAATEAYFAQCPPPDAAWYVEEATKPTLRDIIATVAIRAALDEAAKAARDFYTDEAWCPRAHPYEIGCEIAAAIEALKA